MIYIRQLFTIIPESLIIPGYRSRIRIFLMGTRINNFRALIGWRIIVAGESRADWTGRTRKVVSPKSSYPALFPPVFIPESVLKNFIRFLMVQARIFWSYQNFNPWRTGTETWLVPMGRDPNFTSPATHHTLSLKLSTVFATKTEN